MGFLIITCLFITPEASWAFTPYRQQPDNPRLKLTRLLSVGQKPAMAKAKNCTSCTKTRKGEDD